MSRHCIELEAREGYSGHSIAMSSFQILVSHNEVQQRIRQGQCSGRLPKTGKQTNDCVVHTHSKGRAHKCKHTAFNRNDRIWQVTTNCKTKDQTVSNYHWGWDLRGTINRQSSHVKRERLRYEFKVQLAILIVTQTKLSSEIVSETYKQKHRIKQPSVDPNRSSSNVLHSTVKTQVGSIRFSSPVKHTKTISDGCEKLTNHFSLYRLRIRAVYLLFLLYTSSPFSIISQWEGVTCINLQIQYLHEFSW